MRLISFRTRQRSIAYIALGPAQAGDIAPPTEEAAQQIFRGAQDPVPRAGIPQGRDRGGDAGRACQDREVPDEDVKQIFDTYRNRYITPERRHIEQMAFPSMAEAQAASERIKGGLTFSALAAERGLKEQDLDLGTVPKSTIIDPAVADAAFSLKDGEVSAPVQGRFGAVIVTVSKIIPEEAKTFADVAPQIRNEIALARVKKTVLDIHDKIEDARAGGASLEEAAQKLKLPVVTYDAIDRSGRDPAGKPIENLPHAAEVVNAAFATDVGVDNDPLEADGGYIWYDVTGITPARERTSRRGEEPGRGAVARRRGRHAAEGQGGRHPRQAQKRRHARGHGSANGVKVETATDITRSKPPEPISAQMIDAIFHTALDAYASAEGDKPTQWIVFRVTDVKTPSFEANSPNGKALNEMVSRQVSDDVFGAIHGVAGKRSRHHRQSGGAPASHGRQRAGYQLNADRAFGGKIRRPL